MHTNEPSQQVLIKYTDKKKEFRNIYETSWIVNHNNLLVATLSRTFDDFCKSGEIPSDELFSLKQNKS